mmetsp:Transcript_55202/g.66461  ORF Transcript_55202/g.66461 Transcript_55202/m.66461 type:complete len:236 (+) Transcript_55202:527-1234(+)
MKLLRYASRKGTTEHLRRACLERSTVLITRVVSRVCEVSGEVILEGSLGEMEVLDFHEPQEDEGCRNDGGGFDNCGGGTEDDEALRTSRSAEENFERLKMTAHISKMMFEDGLTLSKSSRASPERMKNALIAIDGQSSGEARFQRIKLVLFRDIASGVMSGSSPVFTVEACSDVTRILCGSLFVKDILENDDLMSVISQLLDGLIDEEILLDWVLEREVPGGDYWKVKDVVLAQL